MKSQELNINGKTVTIDLTKEQIEAINEQTGEKSLSRWRAGHDGNYYYLDCDGDDCYSVEANDEVDDFRHGSGNYFQTRDEAQAYRHKLITTQKIKDRIRELNEGWEPALNGFQIYHLYKNRNGFLIANGQFLHTEKSFCFKSREIGGQIIEEFWDDLNILFD